MMNVFEELRALLKKHPDLVDVGTPASDQDIANAEYFLGIAFPEDYKWFLKEWGNLAFGPFEFYGIVGKDFVNSGIPDAIWYTNRLRTQIGLPRDLIILWNDNGVKYYYLRAIDAESSPVVIWTVEQREIVEIRPDLFSFMLAEIQGFLD